MSNISQLQVKLKLNVDNKSAIALAKNLVYQDRSKHIDTRFHFIRQCVQIEAIELEYVNTDEQLADILTKSFARHLSGVKRENWREEILFSIPGFLLLHRFLLKIVVTIYFILLFISL